MKRKGELDNLASNPKKNSKKSKKLKFVEQITDVESIEKFLSDLALHFVSGNFDDSKEIENSVIGKFGSNDEMILKLAKLILKKFFTNSRMIDLLIGIIPNSTSVRYAIPALIFGHSQFGEVMYEQKYGDEAKLSILKLLKICVLTEGIEEKNILREAHIPVLLGAYSATLSPIDGILFNILRTYEKRADVDFSKFYPLVWGEIGLKKYASLKTLGPALWNRPSTNDVLNCLDSELMKQSCQRLPLKISLDADQVYEFNCYDPRFLLPLFHRILGSESIIDYRLFAIGRSCLSYVTCCLSLQDTTLRSVAYAVLGRFRDHLLSINNTDPAEMKTKFREKPQIHYILNLLRQSIEQPLVRLPTIVSLFLSQAIQLTAMPWHSVYSTVQGYLLMKPSLDLRDVPEFYKLFHSSNSLDRLWILKLLADAFKEQSDYQIFERRNVFRLLLSFYDWAAARNAEYTARRHILRLLCAACDISSTAADLCYRYNLIGWLAGIIHYSKQEQDGEVLARIFTAICENVVVKERTPVYVFALWKGAATLLNMKLLELEKNIHNCDLGKKEAIARFRKCLDSAKKDHK